MSVCIEGEMMHDDSSEGYHLRRRQKSFHGGRRNVKVV